MHPPSVRNPISLGQLNMLRGVFDQACAENRISKDSADAEALAVILVHSLQKGVAEKDRLTNLAEILSADIAR